MIEQLNTLDLQFQGGEVLHDEELNQIVSHINNVVDSINSTIIPAIENIRDGRDGRDGQNGRDGQSGQEGISSLNAFVGAGNLEEALLKLGNRNQTVYPPGQYSIGSNVQINSGEVLFMTSARRRGENNWLFGEDTYIWGVPVQLGIGNTTSTTGVDTDELNYIYCRTFRDIDAAYTSQASLQSIIMNYIEEHPGSGVKVVNNQLSYVIDLDNDTDANINGAWTDHPYGIDETFPHEWMVGYKKNEQDQWEYYFGPIMISNYGFNGLDGDGYEYIFARNDTKNSAPSIDYTANNNKTRKDDDFIPLGWTDEPQGVSDNIGCHYEWVATRKKFGNPAVWHNFSVPSIWGQYAAPGKQGQYRQWAYKNAVSIESNEIPESNNVYPPNGWTSTASTPDFANGEYTWCIDRTVTFDANNQPIYGNWSNPAYRITGDDGQPGTDGKYTEFIYKRSDTPLTFGDDQNNPHNWTSSSAQDSNGKSFNNPDYTGPSAAGWTDNPQGIDADHKYEYMSQRRFNGTSFESFIVPKIWAKWGEKGEDGDGVEYIFYASPTEIPLTGNQYPPNWTTDIDFQNNDYIRSDSGWKDEPIDLNGPGLGQGSIEWVSSRKKENGVWAGYSVPVVWTRLAKDGVAEGYTVDFTNENMPVATSAIGDVPSYTNSGTIQVYYNGIPLSYDTNAGSGHFSYSIGTITRSDGNTVNSAVGATSEKIIATPNGASISVSMTNVSSFDTKNAYVPVTVTLPNGSTNSFNITLFGVPAGQAGEPGDAIDLFLDSGAVKTDYALTTATPSTLNVGVKIGKTIYYSHAVNDSAESLGYSFKYYYDNLSSNPSNVPNTGSITLAANGGTNTPLQSITVIMYYTPSGGSTILVDQETIPYIRDGKKGDDGDSIVSITKTYQISSLNTPETGRSFPSDIQAWVDSSPALTEQQPYLWAKEYIVFTNTSKNTTNYYYIGSRGDNGIDAQDVEWAYVRTTNNVAPLIVASSGEDYWKVDDFKPLAQVSSGSIKGVTEESTNSSVQCTDDPKGVNETWKYEWEIKRTKGSAVNGHREWNNYTPGSAMTLHNNYAESAFIIDLDNDNDQFGTDSNSDVILEQTRSTHVKLYDGATAQTLNTDNAQVPGVSAVLKYIDDNTAVPSTIASVQCQRDTNDTTTGNVTITFHNQDTNNNTINFAKSGLYAEITASCAKGTKAAIFTVRKVMSGQQGLSPVIYQLNPTNKSFVFDRDASNDLTPATRSTTINALKTIGNSTVAAESTDNVTFTWGFDEDSTNLGNQYNKVGDSSGDLPHNQISITNTQANSHYQVWVQLSTGDRETLPIIKQGAKGSSGVKGNFKATCFKRTNTDISETVPTGGTYDSPVATGWNDGIPSGTEKVWATSCTFYGTGGQSAWSTPRPMTDTDTFDVEFAKMQTNDTIPATPSEANRHGGNGTQIWFDPAEDSSEDFTTMYWKAERECKNGVYGNWTILRIKGEQGSPGTSPFVVDCNNEMDSIACSASGTAIEATNLYTEISAFYGSASKTTECTIRLVSNDTGGTVKLVTSGNSTAAGTDISSATSMSYGQFIRVSFSQGAAVAQHGTVELEIIHATYGTRTLKFTINGVRAGNNGQSVTLYSLIPDQNVITKDYEGTPKTDLLTFTVIKRVGETKTVIDTVTAFRNEGLSLYYNNGDSGDQNNPYCVDDNSISNTSYWNGYTTINYHDIESLYESNSKIEWILRKDGTLVDKEGIGSVKDGENGNGINSITKKYARASSGTSASDTTAPTGIDTSIGTSGWANGSPTVTDRYPYLWVKESVDYTNITDTVKYYCIGAKGTRGIDAQDVEWVYIRTKTNVPPVILNDDIYEDSNDCNYTDDGHLPHVNGNSDIENNENTYECTDDPKGVNDTWKFEWEIKRIKGESINGAREWNYYQGTMTLHNNLAESAFIIDTDNDNDQFGTDSESKVLVAQTRRTTVKLYDGSTLQTLTALTASLVYEDGTTTVPTGVAEASCTLNTGVVEVLIKQNSTANSHTEIKALISATCSKGTKNTTFTLRKVMSGQPGLSPIIYQLSPTQKVFSFYRDTSNNLLPASQSSQINVARTEGNTTTILSTAQTGITYSWGFDDSNIVQESNKAIGTSITVSNSDANNPHYQVWVELSTGDKETLPIAKDGTNGTNGQDASEINPNMLLRTLFKSISSIQEKWQGTFTTLNEYYTPTPDGEKVNGYNIIRSEQSNSDSIDIFQNVALASDTWYTFSFWLRQTTISELNNQAPILSVYMSYDSSSSSGGTPGCVSEYYVDNGSIQTLNDGGTEFSGGTWNPTKHTIRFKTVSDISLTSNGSIRFRFSGGINVISMPKLEIGQVATAYVANEADLEGKHSSYEEKQYANYDSDSVDVSGIPTGNRQGSWLTSIPATSTSYPYLWERVRQRTYDINNQLVILGADAGWTYGLLTKPGAPGQAGSAGRMYYPAGEYDNIIEYTRNSNVCPVVHYTDQNVIDTGYWYLNADTNVVNNVHIAPSSSGNDNPWQRAVNYGMVITEALFAQFAKLGSFIVFGDFFISQHGTLFNSSGAVEVTSSRIIGNVYIQNNIPYLALSTDDMPCYTYFDSSDPMVETLPTSGNYKFRPMKVVNARTGEEWMAEGKVHVDADGSVTMNDVEVNGSMMYHKVVTVDISWGVYTMTYDASVYVEGQKPKMYGDIFILMGNKINARFTVVLPPTSASLEGLKLKIIRGFHSNPTQNIWIEAGGDMITIERGTDSPMYNVNGIYDPMTGYFYPEYDINKFSQIELVVGNAFTDQGTKYYQWVVLSAQEGVTENVGTGTGRTMVFEKGLLKEVQ